MDAVVLRGAFISVVENAVYEWSNSVFQVPSYGYANGNRETPCKSLGEDVEDSNVNPQLRQGNRYHHEVEDHSDNIP